MNTKRIMMRMAEETGRAPLKKHELLLFEHQLHGIVTSHTKEEEGIEDYVERGVPFCLAPGVALPSCEARASRPWGWGVEGLCRV